ncbi:uncharacterized protein TRAVEDRAFT_133376 [Trametes versicolor FP-101664 SS1]|uniref:uncharacterized protein n=1 Tax=Trametes versicolor (strain FP-101664) TaxID=717944 RepID=UPI000462288E|nr:uncharacterized protein TRAVEDRAFT_133376 [Trametes versicolor FP-101664 SS1]EIW53755.1 hypothetical protein TRAVEDRAFT_133376 [Trametes versicolor FP-101664 SS1]
MHAPRVSLCALPPDVLEEIAFHVALSDVLGPPVHLIPLLCTCQHLNAVLCRRNNVYLYARIYAAKFDSRAAPRRMGPKAGQSSALAAQLPKYCTALRNIRRGDIDSPTLVTDFLRAFAMCLENDGKNAAQLEWAHLFEYAEQFILERLWEESESNSSSGWPVEDVTNSLVLWLYWYSSSQERFASKTAEERAQLMALVRPYALYGFRYPPFLAPDNHANLPLPGSPEAYREHSTVTPHGYYPLYREPALCKHTFRHYGRALTLAEPPIGLIAKLLYIALQEHKPIDVDQPIPDDREEAVLLGARGPTRADYIEFARTKAARYPVRGGLDLAMRHAGASESHDNDWARWRGCFNPWGAPSRDRSAVYTFGSLTGNWAGRSLVSRVASFRVRVSAYADGPRRTRTDTNTRTRRTRASSTRSSRSRTGRMLLRTRCSSRCASTAPARGGVDGRVRSRIGMCSTATRWMRGL